MGQRDNPGRDRAMSVVGAALGVKIAIDVREDRDELISRVAELRRGVDELEQWLHASKWRPLR